MLGLPLGIHVQNAFHSFYIAYPACQLRRGRETTFYGRTLAKLIALLFATRAREPLPLWCFGASKRNKHLPHSVNLPPKTSAHPHAYIANTSWPLIYKQKNTPPSA